MGQLKPFFNPHDPDVRLPRAENAIEGLKRRSQMPRSLAFGALAMRCTGVQTGGGNTLAAHFSSFDWTQTEGDTLLDLSTNQPEVLISGLYFVDLQVETIATLAAGAQWQAHYIFKSTPWGTPFGTFDADAHEREARVFADGATVGMRDSIRGGPYAMNNDDDNNGAGADRFRLDVFYAGGPDLTGASTATAKLFVVLL